MRLQPFKLRRILLATLLVMAACSPMPKLSFYGVSGLVSFEVEMARTASEQARGLMFRKELAERHGMFFVFNTTEIRRFWMKNTTIPLDLLFFDENMTIVDIVKGTRPLDSSLISSARPARYVLEINAGLAQKYNLEVGMRGFF